MQAIKQEESEGKAMRGEDKAVKGEDEGNEIRITDRLWEACGNDK